MKLIIAHLDTEFSPFYGTRRFIAVFKRARPFWDRSIQSTSCFFYFHFNIILSVLGSPNFYLFISSSACYVSCASVHPLEIWGSHGGKDVDVVLLGCNAVWTCRQIPTFRRNILPPSSGLTHPTCFNHPVLSRVDIATLLINHSYDFILFAKKR
jgi:hypothetical protein